MTRPPVRVGVVGLGAVARAVYLPLLARRADLFAVAALCDLSPHLLAHYGDELDVSAAHRHPDLSSLLDGGDVDAILVLTSGSHAEASRLAVAAGVPALVEKPLGYTLADLEPLGTTSCLQLGYMKLFDPAVRRALQVRADRPPPRAVDVTVLHPPMADQLAHLPAPPMRPEPGPPVSLIPQWTAALGDEAAAVLGPLYTDVLLGSLVHDLYVVRALAGDPTAIDWATTWQAGDGPGSVEFAGPLPGGGRLSVRWHHLAAYPAYREEVRVHDDAGSVELTFPAPYLLQHPTDLRVVDRAGPAERVTTFRSTHEAFEEQLVAFHGLVVEGGTPEISVADGRRDVVTCQRIARTLAAASGIPIGGEAAHA